MSLPASTIDAAIELFLQVVTHAGPVSAAIARAHGEGRTITREELEEAFVQDDLARAALSEAIARAGG